MDNSGLKVKHGKTQEKILKTHNNIKILLILKTYKLKNKYLLNICFFIYISYQLLIFWRSYEIREKICQEKDWMESTVYTWKDCGNFYDFGATPKNL